MVGAARPREDNNLEGGGKRGRSRPASASAAWNRLLVFGIKFLGRRPEPAVASVFFLGKRRLSFPAAASCFRSETCILYEVLRIWVPR